MSIYSEQSSRLGHPHPHPHPPSEPLSETPLSQAISYPATSVHSSRSVTPRVGKLPSLGNLHQQRHVQKQAHIAVRRNQQMACSLKDRIYQSSFALRKAVPSTPMGYAQLTQAMAAFFKLSNEEAHCLEGVVRGVVGNDTTDVKAFLTALNTTDKEMSPGLEQLETKRFDVQGIMDSAIQKVMKNPKAHIAMSHNRPENELGKVTVNPPFGVMGDSERMNALISCHLDLKFDTLKAALSAHDASGKGRVTHGQFSKAMRETAHYLFESELQALISIVDPKKRGYIVIDEFLNGVGMEFLKKKTDRGSLNGDPLVWAVAPVPPRVAAPKQRLRAPSTKASRLRKTDSKVRLEEEAARVEIARVSPPRKPPPRKRGGKKWQTVEHPDGSLPDSEPLSALVNVGG